MFAKIHKALEKREGGFTLIELLVVMIIIGILAAVAIPIFMNQQKTSRDTATTSDVKNVATNIQSLLVQEPDATTYSIGATTNGKATLTVGAQTTEVSLTNGTVINVYRGRTNGTFVVTGHNTAGKNYTAAPAAGAAVSSTTGEFPTGAYLVYNSETGGLKR